MRKSDLIKILERVPDDAEIYWVKVDDAWSARARIFENDNAVYICVSDEPKHRNFPAQYSGFKELNVEL